MYKRQTLGSRVSPKECIPKISRATVCETKPQDERVQTRTAGAGCVASANDLAELMNQMPQHNGMWLRRDALGAILYISQRCPSRPRQRLLRAPGYSWCSDGVLMCKFLAAFFYQPKFQIFQVGPAEASLS